MDTNSQSGMLSPNNSSTSFNNPSLSSISDANSSIYGRDSSTWQLNKNNASSFIKKHGRTYCSDESLPYPLPCDPEEVNHRQSLLHLLYRELLGGYYIAPFHTAADIPKRVLDIGCGNGQWIASVADEFAAMGRPDVEFVGLDLVQVHSEMTGVNFTFKQVNVLQQGVPLPFANDEFDYIITRENTMIVPQSLRYEDLFPEYMRILKPGGVLEIQCSDHTIRSLQRSSAAPDLSTGAYSVSPSTPFAARPENPFVQTWNSYITELLNKRLLPVVPCTLMQPLLIMESEHLGQVTQRRLALPLDDPVWEEELLKNNVHTSTPRKSVDSVITADSGSDSDSDSDDAGAANSDSDDNVSFVTAEGSISALSPTPSRRSFDFSSAQSSKRPPAPTSPGNPFALKLSEDAKGVRYLARELLTEFISSLEPMIREANSVPQDEWDRWYRDLMKNFFEDGGLKGGECLEVGAWYAVKHQAKEKDKDKEREKELEREREREREGREKESNRQSIWMTAAMLHG